MSLDILSGVREEILREDEKALPWIPEHLNKTWEAQAGIAGAIAGVWSGAAIGMHMGLAGPWGAIAGTVPCAIVGGVMGYFTAAKAGSSIKRDNHIQAEWYQGVNPNNGVNGSTVSRRLEGKVRKAFTTLNWRIADLPHQIGRVEQQGWAVNVLDDRPGMLQYGPYTTDVPEGSYLAGWELRIDNNTANNNVVLHLDVYDATDDFLLAEHDICRADFIQVNTYQSFWLPFHVPLSRKCHMLEFRVLWTGEAHINATTLRCTRSGDLFLTA